MNPRNLGTKLREESLAHAGSVPLAALIEWFVPVKELRAAAQSHGLSPKGFRADRAPAKALIPLLIDPETPEVLEEVCDLLAGHMTPGSGDPAPAAAEPVADLQPMLKLREGELKEARQRLEKCRSASDALRRRSDTLAQARERDQENIARLQAELDTLRREVVRLREARPGADRDLSTRVQALERELDEQSQIEQQHRIKAAEQAALLRARDERIVELLELVPKGRRQKPRGDPPAPPAGLIVPHFTTSFLKSLASKDRRAVEHAYRAVFLYCTEGPRYPGLQVKSLEPSNVWSLRASRRLRG
ncbi:MAG: hypothetical protein KDC87_14700, partial [Planctomycetes bacterium]|nr:hypothetical protein [Planctomycetota bacterium]